MSENGAHGTTRILHARMKNLSDAARAPMSPATGKVRIIAGRWRGTRMPVPDRPGLRPAADRMRETLFNCLQPMLPGARVLDLFAGSGALGLEAVSRGAAQATLVERDGELARSLQAIADRLEGGAAVAVVQADALAWVHGQPDAAFDLAFVDPPFDANLWGGVLPALVPKLAADAWLYVESPLDAPSSLTPEWALHREGRTRDVRYALYRRQEYPQERPPDQPRVTLDADSIADGATTA